MRLNELDKLFILNYTIGFVLFLIGIVGGCIVLFFDSLPLANHIRHSLGIGNWQVMGAVVCGLLSIGSIAFVLQTLEYQKHYGE